jgi:preprotein translocase subunit SecG
MGLIGIVLLVILVISSILLVLVVLVQDEQGEGIGGIFGGGSSTAFGSRSGNVLTRFTAILAAVFLLCCFGLAWVSKTPTSGNVLGKAREQALQSNQQQTWYLQTPVATTSAPAGTTPGGAAAPAGTAPSTTTPAGSTAAPATSTTAPASAPQSSSSGNGGR